MYNGRPQKQQLFLIRYYELYKTGRSPLRTMFHVGGIDRADDKLSAIQQSKKCSILIDSIEPIRRRR